MKYTEWEVIKLWKQLREESIRKNPWSYNNQEWFLARMVDEMTSQDDICWRLA